MIKRKLVILVVLFCAIESIVRAEDNWLGSEWNLLQKVYDDCQNKDDFIGCIKGRALTAMDKAADRVIFNIQLV